ncbi:MAG: glycosyltransferase family 2 protein [Saprospiraceae bacterium]|nr:glycosyltransferase family 2 protein [Saprospiraceae bacterium]
MKVTGFSFIRNAVKYDYPIREAILSVLPVCDDFVVAVGRSEDKTLEMIKSIGSPKIRIIETQWDESLRSGGSVLAEETNKAYAAIDPDTDWCFYIQGDEVLHEKYHPEVVEQMRKWKDDEKVDGLLFDYQHFYGSYDYVGTSSDWYKSEIRIIRKRPDIYSFRDAQGFRKGNNIKLKVKAIDACIYHYGWVKHPEDMQKKQQDFNKLWHSDEKVSQITAKSAEFDYSNINGLKKFEGTHPEVMLERIQSKNWVFDHDISKSKFSVKDWFKVFVLKYLNWDIGYRNYKKI